MVVHGRHIEGNIKSGESWRFLTRFVFQPTKENVESSINRFRFHRKTRLVLLAYFDGASCAKGTLILLDFYRDDPCQFKDWAARQHGNAFDLWTSYDKIMTEKEESSKGIYKNLTEYKDVLDDYEYREASGKLVFGSSRNRWFYFAVANCKAGTKEAPKEDPNY